MYLFKNGTIHTMNGGTVEAVAVEGDRIYAIGTLNDVREKTGTCKEIDLEGKCMVPGLIDSHCHLQHTGVKSIRMDFRGAHSLRDMIDIGRTFIEEHDIPDGEWIVGEGFNQNLFDVPELPTKATADAITTRHPLLLDRICCHIGTLNSLGLEKMGYTSETRMDGGSIDLGEDGTPNGILRENALYKVTNMLPKADTPRGVADLLAEGMHRMNSFGVTSVHSDDLEGIDPDILDEAIDILRREDRMTVRLFEELLMSDISALKNYLSRGKRTGDGDHFYKVGNIKLILDGSLGAKTAYMRSCYPGTDDRGFNVYTDAEVSELVNSANTAGMQVACHAIGDGAAEQMIRAVEQAHAVHPTQLRHRIVHGQFLGNDQLMRAAALGMAIDIQPAFTATDWTAAEACMNRQQVADSYRWRDMLDMGIVLGAGSDCPVEECDPIWGIHCAVNRTDENHLPEGGWMPHQKLTPYEALELYTRSGAYLSFEEDIKGTIEVGKLADLTILSEDPCAVAPERIREIRCVETIVGGRTVYRD